MGTAFENRFFGIPLRKKLISQTGVLL